MRRFIGNRAGIALSLAVTLVGWWLLTRIYPPLVVPPPSSVAEKLCLLLASPAAWRVIGLTCLRLVTGLALGIVLGSGLGALLARFSLLHAMFRPLVGLAQSVPLVSWLVLALIWFGFSGQASVFIVVVATLPVMTIAMIEGMGALDRKLIQMAVLYRFSAFKRLRHVIAPSLLPSFRAGVQVAIGLGGKTVVMGEVLTTATGIGGQITDARLNLEPESVVAWTIVIVILYYLLNGLASILLRGRRRTPC